MEFVMYTGKMIEELVQCVLRAELLAQLDCQIALKKAVLNSEGYSTYVYESVQSEKTAVV
jgi:hypothetical protein